MMLFIPEIGTELTLAEDWTFPLHFERRNEPLGKLLNLQPPNSNDRYSRGWWQPDQSTPVTLPAGTILKVDRIYIRKSSWGEDASAFSSLSFFALMPGFKKKGRFWAKLADVNRIQFELKE